jgi:hypothetical protein
MNVASRPVATGKTRICPHCKATILESLSICPGCLHHLRFDQEAAKRQVAATSALRVEGVIQHPPHEDPWEYFVVIAVRNDRGEEVARQVVSVGALQHTEKRTFTLSVEVLPPQAPAANGSPKAASPASKPAPAMPARPATASAPARPATPSPPARPTTGTPSGAGGAAPPPSGGPKR